MIPKSFTPHLTFLSDPGHGWLVVPLADIARSGSADHISRYSFIDTRNGVAYLWAFSSVQTPTAISTAP